MWEKPRIDEKKKLKSNAIPTIFGHVSSIFLIIHIILVFFLIFVICHTMQNEINTISTIFGKSSSQTTLGESLTSQATVEESSTS